MPPRRKRSACTLEIGPHGTLIYGGHHSDPANGDLLEAMSRIIASRGGGPGAYTFGKADLPAVRAEVAVVAWERRRDARLIIDLLEAGEATPAVQRVAADLLMKGKPLPKARPSPRRDHAIAIEVDRLREGGMAAGAAHRQVAADFGLSIKAVELAVRRHAGWLEDRKAELPPGTRPGVFL